jgi:hypothetical protein
MTDIVTVAAFDTAPCPSATVYVNVSVPMNPTFGVYVTDPFPSGIAAPLPGEDTIATDAASIPTSSVSLEVTFIETGTSVVVDAESSLATGGWFGGGAATVTVTVAAFDTAPRPSDTVYWNVSVPEKPPFGVYVTDPFPSGIADPLPGEDTIATDAASIPTSSVSFEITLTEIAVSIVVTAESSLAAGGWSTVTKLAIVPLTVPDELAAATRK